MWHDEWVAELANISVIASADMPRRRRIVLVAIRPPTPRSRRPRLSCGALAAEVLIAFTQEADVRPEGGGRGESPSRPPSVKPGERRVVK